MLIYLYNDFPHYQPFTDFVLFRDFLISQKGIYVTNNLDSAEILIFFDYIQVRKIDKLIEKYNNKFKVLIRTEPISVFKNQYIDKIPFNLVLDLGKMNSLDSNRVFIEWPIGHSYFQKQPQESKIKYDKFAFINSNKFGNLNFFYFLRRRIVYELYYYVETIGKGWSILDFNWRNYFGNLINVFFSRNFTELRYFKIFINKIFIKSKKNYMSKIEILNNFKYILVIENSDSYISEKLIEALLLNKIVVYSGNSLIGAPIPKNFFFINVPPDFNIIKSTLQNIITDKYLIQTFDNSSLKSELSNWKSENVWDKILNIILNNFNKNSFF